MDASARQLSNRFFEAFKADLTGGVQAPEASSLVPQEMTAVSASASAASAQFPVVSQAHNAASNAHSEGWFDKEKSRLLWFVAGVATTTAGMWMGTHWLR